jgi:pyruvate/2-oxoglutarate dehydrogenase complex dihydrolipoamide dehydrogenase (E3) component
MVTDGGRILPREEPGAALAVHRQLEREGISMLCGTRVVRARREGGDVILSVEQEGAESEVCGDTVLVAVGRTPNVEGLDLEAARVEYDSRGVKVDSLLRTSNRRVFAAGDVCSDFKFTHAADAMARVVLANALFKLRCKAGDLLIPRCTYTDPEVAQVGLSEEAARRTGVDAACIRVEMNSNDRALIDGESEGFTAVVYDKRSRRLLGGTIVARHAGEMIGELTLAVRTRRRIGDLAGTIHPYPTQAESLKRAGDTFRRNCLTASKRQWLAHWFRWTR